MKHTWIIIFALALMPLSLRAQQRWWGNYSDAMTPSFMGLSTAETYHCCSQFTGSRAILSGATLHGVRFYLRDKTNVQDVKVWLSKTRPATNGTPDIMQVDVDPLQLADLEHDQRWLEVTLPTPYTFDGSTIYVGYSFKQNTARTTADQSPVACAGRGKGTTGSFHLRTSKTLMSWNDVTAQFGALALQLLVSNPSLPAQGVQLQQPDRLVGMVNSTLQTTISIASAGLAEVKSIDYVVTADGQQLASQHCDLSATLWGPGNTTTLPLSFTAPATAASTQYAVEVTQVNGQPNGATGRQAANQLVAVSQLATRRSVVEEYTGTWCTNCPRGMVGMENLQREFGDRFVGIAVHNDDPMALSAYQSLVPSGIPKCSMDRSLVCDPYIGVGNDYHFHANEAFQYMLEQPAEADITLTARWVDEEQTTIGYRATSTFYLNAAEADYALAFVLTADGLRGNTKEWYQVNGESGKNTFPDADMDRFRNAPNPVQDIEYNHVAIAVQGIGQGVEGSITSPIADAQPQTYSGTLSVRSNSLVQDKSRLTANILLLNKTTGQVVNAAKTAIAAYDPDGIVATKMQPAVSTQYWFNAGGQRVASPTRSGLYVKNGKKLIIK